jgi:hypothetical protein
MMVIQSMKEMMTAWELVIMVTKTSVAQEVFFITAALEFWKFDRLVATKLSFLSILVLRNCSKFSLKNQSIN